MDSAKKRDLSRDSLQCTWVTELEKTGETWLANGFVMIFDDVVVYVQHTSKKPITADFVEDIATDLIFIRARADAALNDPKK